MSVRPIPIAHLHALVPSPPVLAWHEKPEAVRLLATIDAAERSSNSYTGLGWHGVAEAFTDQAADAQCDLEGLRGEAVDAEANATGAVKHSEAWDDAWDAADEALTTVADAVKRARRDHAGDALFEQADAA